MDLRLLPTSDKRAIDHKRSQEGMLQAGISSLPLILLITLIRSHYNTFRLQTQCNVHYTLAIIPSPYYVQHTLATTAAAAAAAATTTPISATTSSTTKTNKAKCIWSKKAHHN